MKTLLVLFVFAGLIQQSIAQRDGDERTWTEEDGVEIEVIKKIPG